MYRKAFRCCGLVILAFALYAQPLSAAKKTEKIRVTFVSAELIENNHVGNEWWSGGYVNGKELEEGSSVNVNATSNGSILLKAEVQEQDSSPDDGEASAAVKMSAIKSTVTKKLNVTVTEDRGRYSGNTAQWRFTFKITRIK